MPRLIDALHSGRVLLMDGAMGTELQRAGILPGECHDLWSVTQPERVLAIHKAYIAAGAESLLTNTFQTNWASLSSHGLHQAEESIRQAGVRLAREGGAAACYVLLDIGPLDKKNLPAGCWTREIVEGLTRGAAGVDAVLLETFSDANALAISRLLTQSNFLQSQVPVLLSLSFDGAHRRDLRTVDGQQPEDWANAAMDAGIAALGVNCGRDIGMDEIIEIVRRYRQVTDLPLFARPNAGTPRQEGNQWVYPQTPEMMADRLPELLEAGVSMVGGCCGTTPAHIAVFRKVIDAWNARRA
jgi:methionine synthase I (cobalamin-dependent)